MKKHQFDEIGYASDVTEAVNLLESALRLHFDLLRIPICYISIENRKALLFCKNCYSIPSDFCNDACDWVTGPSDFCNDGCDWVTGVRVLTS